MRRRFTADTTVYAKWLEKLTVTIVYSDGTQEVYNIYEGEMLRDYGFKLGNKDKVYIDSDYTKELYGSLGVQKLNKDFTYYVKKG